MADPVTLAWDLDTPAPLDAAWAVMSDTDAFNRAAGMGYAFEERPQADGTVARVGRTTKFGMTFTWDELPWTFEAPRGFRVERRFHGGPASHYVVECRLEPIPRDPGRRDGSGANAGGTRIRYAVSVFPRSLLGRPVVLLDAQVTTKPQLDRALKEVLSKLQGQPSLLDERPPALPAEVEARVDATVAKLGPPALAQGLRDVLRRAPLRTQDRLRPLQLATSWQVTGDAAVRGLLQGVREGLLELRFELLCPSCLGPKATSETMPAAGVRVHCSSCHIDYDGSFPDSVEVVLRPAAWVRSTAVPVDCVSSPARTPHVVAQAVLGPKRETEVTATLEAGTSYRLHTRGATSSAVIEVVEGAPIAASVVIEPDGVRPAVLRMGAGPVTIAIRSKVDRTALAVVEKRWRPADALTASRLVEVDGARELLPGSALRANAPIESFPAAVLVVEGADGDVRERLAALLPRRLYTGNGHTIGVWDEVAGAVAGMRAVAGPTTGVALNRGLVTVVGDVPGGEGVGEALFALRRAGRGRVVVPASRLDGAELKAALGDVPVRIGENGLAFLTIKASAPIDRRRSSTPGALAGQYKLGDVLGEGGFGKVYAAEELATGRQVAVKLLLPEMADQPGVVQRFYNEARVVFRLECPHTVRVYDYGQADDDRLYMVMERLVGRDLEGAVVAADVARRHAIAVLTALEEAHERGVVHRDIKPGNVLVCKVAGRDDFVKVIDFGIATAPGEVDDDGLSLGTPRYMSPEQLEGGVVDGRSDVYAVGLLLYEALSGRLPWDGGAPHAAVFRRLVEPAAPLEGVPADLAASVAKALQHDADERWPSARAMREALEHRGAPGFSG